jgi:hypothetical protein
MKSNRILPFLIIVLLAGVATTSISAQKADKPLTFGMRAGINSSGFSHYGEVYSLCKSGLVIGAFGEFNTGYMASASVEINYIQQGAFHIEPGSVYPANEITIYNVTKAFSDIKLHTINIPFIASFRPISDGSIFPKFSLGFSFDFIMSARSKNMLYYTNTVTGIKATIPDRSNDVVTSSFKTLNYGPLAAFGLDFKSNPLTYSIEVRYYIGLNDINNLASMNNITSNTTKYDFSYNSLSVTFGVGF